MILSTRVKTGICSALIALITAGGAANAMTTVENRRYESIGYAASMMCSIWQGDIDKRQGVRLIRNQLHSDDLKFFTDDRVRFIIRAVATDMAKNEVNCDIQDELSFTERNLPFLFKARDIMQTY